MNQEIIEHRQPPAPDNLRNYAIAVYALYAVSFILGVTLLAGVVIAYMKRREATGSVYHSHFQYLIKTFWASLLGFVIGMITMLIGIGGLIVLAVSVWFVYRVVAGFIKLNDGKPVSTDSWF